MLYFQSHLRFFLTRNLLLKRMDYLTFLPIRCLSQKNSHKHWTPMAFPILQILTRYNLNNLLRIPTFVQNFLIRLPPMIYIAMTVMLLSSRLLTQLLKFWQTISVKVPRYHCLRTHIYRNFGPKRLWRHSL